MTKQEQFLWVVQTMWLANAINLSSRPEQVDEHRAEISASGAFITMDEAIRASERIPSDLSATKAAQEFCTFCLKNLRDTEEEAAGKSLTVPHWFARQ